MKGELVLVRPVRGIKQVGLRLSGTKSLERTACPCPFGSWNNAGRTSYVWNEVARMEGLSTSIRYEESSRQNFIHLVQSYSKGGFVLIRLVRCRVKGKLVLFRSVRGIKLAKLHTTGPKSCEWRACPCQSGTRNQAGGTSSV